MCFHPPRSAQKMPDSLKGFVAGTAATLVVSGLMLLERVLGITPQLGLIQLLLRAIGAPESDRALGWLVHVVAGTVVAGPLFAWLEPRLQADSATKRGVLFGVILWLLFMLVIMPAAGAGLFGFEVSQLAPLVLLVLHLAYGVVLGWSFGKLREQSRAVVRCGVRAQRS